MCRGVINWRGEEMKEGDKDGRREGRWIKIKEKRAWEERRERREERRERGRRGGSGG
jgi:hypothetical protein